MEAIWQARSKQNIKLLTWPLHSQGTSLPFFTVYTQCCWFKVNTIKLFTVLGMKLLFYSVIVGTIFFLLKTIVTVVVIVLKVKGHKMLFFWLKRNWSYFLVGLDSLTVGSTWFRGRYDIRQNDTRQNGSLSFLSSMKCNSAEYCAALGKTTLSRMV